MIFFSDDVEQSNLLCIFGCLVINQMYFVFLGHLTLIGLCDLI
jgi:hypothetical protein